jgi:hypothetical protein
LAIRYWDGYYTTTGQRYDVHDSTGGRGLVTVARDELGHDTSVGYDAYALLPATVTDAAGLLTRAEYDYRVLKPHTIVDPNGNRVGCSYTPLGMPATVARLGKQGTQEGDTDAQPGIAYTYGLLGYDDANPRPVSVHTVRRVEHRWDVVRIENEQRARDGLPPLTSAEQDALFLPDELQAAPGRFVQRREFTDGLGRLLQARAQHADVRFGDRGPSTTTVACPPSRAAIPEA